MSAPDLPAQPDLPVFDIPAEAPLGLAVSGGPDSLALLLLAARARPDRLRAATVDHQLRPDSRAEAEAAAALCARIGVPHDILTVRVEGSLQAAARAARYAALGQWCVAHSLTHIATAHHADDQAETLLMRLARGAGLSGLASIRAARPLCPGVTLVRPLLDRRKAELEAIVAAAGIEPARDPSNADPRYDRTAARALLAATDWLDPARLAHSAAHLAASEAALEWAADRALAERFDGASLDPEGLPPELLRRILLRIFAAHGETPRGPDLARLTAALHSGRTATLGPLKATPGERWTFTPAPPRRTRK
ncbi:tRNA(Ile)-lysidine synthetase [Sphingomonas changbaiensis NBRC 104936]|uniref:tRNA(Ile)-lysidine synthase n=1 Tax=Sphingomonas changbaiensis NBRC 104936 TaxID=1219043 RepID=A0A0E9MUX6_9SPHN|nr:tRNA lysidine(34) synthetase TilS [Sphingomonas changbaiensis]GAO40925.1 tRNA(Ile)-lysidine synthetase [Sphingomonas changbaiensis NBRC 104936]